MFNANYIDSFSNTIHYSTVISKTISLHNRFHQQFQNYITLQKLQIQVTTIHFHIFQFQIPYHNQVHFYYFTTTINFAFRSILQRLQPCAKHFLALQLQSFNSLHPKSHYNYNVYDTVSIQYNSEFQNFNFIFYII